MVQALQNRLRIREQVAKKHHQTLGADHHRQLVEALGDVSLTGRLQVRQYTENCAELGPAAVRRQTRLDGSVERDQAGRVLLVDHQVTESSSQAYRVLELGQLLPIGVGHRGA